MYISQTAMGLIPKVTLRQLWDFLEFEKSKKSHVSILGTYGTSPMSRLYASMGLVPYDVMGYLWDLVEKIQDTESHA